MNWDVPGSMLQAYMGDQEKSIAANAALTVRQVKYTAGEILADPEDRDLKRCADFLRACIDSAYQEESLNAFMEKRYSAFQARLRSLL